MATCHGTQIDGPPGGVRFVRACPRTPIEGGDLCWQHQQEQDYSRRQFDRMMETASRHRRSVSVHRKGTWCLCGVFVRTDEPHPWDMTTSDEEAAMRNLFEMIAVGPVRKEER